MEHNINKENLFCDNNTTYYCLSGLTSRDDDSNIEKGNDINEFEKDNQHEMKDFDDEKVNFDEFSKEDIIKNYLHMEELNDTLEKENEEMKEILDELIGDKKKCKSKCKSLKKNWMNIFLNKKRRKMNCCKLLKT